MKPIIFARISDMKYYKGVTENDKPKNGGSWVAENEYAHECHNFLPIEFEDGSVLCLGYSQLIGGSKNTEPQLHIEKIYGCEKFKSKESVDDVIVVFCAKDVSMRVVGFYKHATVFRKNQLFTINEGTEYEYDQWVEFIADKENCILIPPHDRYTTSDWYVPMSGKNGYTFGFGHSNIWFSGSNTDNLKEIQYVEKMIKNIENYKGENWIDKYE